MVEVVLEVVGTTEEVVVEGVVEVVLEVVGAVEVVVVDEVVEVVLEVVGDVEVVEVVLEDEAVELWCALRKWSLWMTWWPR